MAEIIRMPRLSDTMEEGNIVSWLKKVGDPVKSGDVLAEVETDKATMELESFHNGYLLYIGVNSGMVPVEGIIAIIGQQGEDIEKILSDSGNNKSVIVEKVESAKDETNSIPKGNTNSKQVEQSNPNLFTQATNETTHDTGRIFASPLAKSLAEKSGIDIKNVSGSGEQGRIVKKDIENYVASGVVQTVQANQSINQVIATAQNEDTEVPVTQMRKVIAKRLGESKFTAPHFYLTLEIDMTNAIAARESINADGNVKISFNDFVIKACAYALKKHPMINSSWYGDKIVMHGNVNIGVAVAVPDGLLVPVINNADLKGLHAINQEVKALAGKAKEKKLQPNEMTGNTFTISNLGMFDIEEFTAIINPPDACILAVGTIIQKPVVKNGAIVIGNTMKVTLSCDHRVVDGATGAQFLQTLKSVLENPIKMMV
jgi:pyruvate dehydrogenase E2 component (dihydrolipoamide acetyltransferase)